MRLIFGTLVVAGAVAAASLQPAAAQAQAQTHAGIAIGMPVVDAAGGAVGTVAGLKGDNVLVKTGRHEALLPKTSFTLAEGKLLFGMTQAQLDAEIDQSMTAASAAIVAGATVTGTGGAALGQIETVAGGDVTIALASGQKIQVSADALRGNSDGSVTIGYTAEQLQKLVTAPAPAETEAAASAPAETGGQ